MDEDKVRDLLRSLSGDELVRWVTLGTEEMQRRRHEMAVRALQPALVKAAL